MSTSKNLSHQQQVKLLDNWNVLNSKIMDLKEREVWNLLVNEIENRQRQQVMLRLHARGNKLRAIRERNEVFAGTFKPYK